jgi:hypothetical protein
MRKVQVARPIPAEVAAIAYRDQLSAGEWYGELSVRASFENWAMGTAGLPVGSADKRREIWEHFEKQRAALVSPTMGVLTRKHEVVQRQDTDVDELMGWARFVVDLHAPAHWIAYEMGVAIAEAAKSQPPALRDRGPRTKLPRVADYDVSELLRSWQTNRILRLWT